MRNVFLGFCFILTGAASAETTKLSRVSFYGKQAGVLFDLIANPTTTRHFHLFSNHKKIGATQKALGKRWECTIHGTEEDFPTESSQASLKLCSVSAEVVRVTMPTDGGSFSFDGKTGAELFELIPGEGKTLHDNLYKTTFTQKSHGSAGLDGLFCQRNVPDDAALETVYNCHISWRK